jgi:transposase
MRHELGPQIQPSGTRRVDLSTHRWQRPLFVPEEAKQVVDTVENSEPQDHGLPGRRWTLRKLRRWLADKYERIVSKATLHKILHAAQMTWKKCKKLLAKGDPAERVAFVERFLKLYEQVVRGEIILVYVDESHFHRDMENGYTWGRIGKRVWRFSCCAPLSDRINWYGAYNFSDGECFIWNEGNCNKEHTVQFLRRLVTFLVPDGRRVVVIWDNAPWHKAHLAQQAAKALGIELVRLPSYSPDLNAIEGLWKWMREEVTQMSCYHTLRELFEACKKFIDNINDNAMEIVNRLWPRFELDAETEKLRFSA